MIEITDNKLFIVAHDGESLEFRFAVWNALESSQQQALFGVTNEYLYTLPPQNLRDIFQCFKDAHGILERFETVAPTIKALKVVAGRIFENINYVKAYNWAYHGGKIQMEMTTPEMLSSTNPRETTYIRQECFDLTVFAMLFKILAPIVGTLCRVISPYCGNTHKEDQAMAVINGTGWAAMEPYIRHCEYWSHTAERKTSKTTSTVVRHGLPVAELGGHFASLSILRRLVTYPIGKAPPIGGVISFCYKFIEGKVNKYKVSFRDKFDTATGDGDTALVEQSRIPEDQDATLRQTISSYAEDIPLMTRQLSSEINVENVQARYSEMINRKTEIHDLHTTFISLLLNPIMERWVIDTSSRRAKLSAIALASEVLMLMGLPDLAALLCASRTPKAITDMSLNRTDEIIAKLPVATEKILRTRYPYLPQQTKAQLPGLVLIESVVKQVNTHEWDGIPEGVSFVNLRESVARMLISPRLSSTDDQTNQIKRK